VPPLEAINIQSEFKTSKTKEITSMRTESMKWEHNELNKKSTSLKR
jgi:hypothetical protein